MVPDAEHSMATGIFVLVPAMINYYNAINLKYAVMLPMQVFLST